MKWQTSMQTFIQNVTMDALFATFLSILETTNGNNEFQNELYEKCAVGSASPQRRNTPCKWNESECFQFSVCHVYVLSTPPPLSKKMKKNCSNNEAYFTIYSGGIFHLFRSFFQSYLQTKLLQQNKNNIGIAITMEIIMI